MTKVKIAFIGKQEDIEHDLDRLGIIWNGEVYTTYPPFFYAQCPNENIDELFALPWVYSVLSYVV